MSISFEHFKDVVQPISSSVSVVRKTPEAQHLNLASRSVYVNKQNPMNLDELMKHEHQHPNTVFTLLTAPQEPTDNLQGYGFDDDVVPEGMLDDYQEELQEVAESISSDTAPTVVYHIVPGIQSTSLTVGYLISALPYDEEEDDLITVTEADAEYLEFE